MRPAGRARPVVNRRRTSSPGVTRNGSCASGAWISIVKTENEGLTPTRGPRRQRERRRSEQQQCHARGEFRHVGWIDFIAGAAAGKSAAGASDPAV